MPGENDHIVAETAGRIFADLADPQTINRMENGAWKELLWQTLGDAGLPLAWVPEKLGGSGASLAEGFAILGVAGRFPDITGTRIIARSNSTKTTHHLKHGPATRGGGV